MIPIEVTAVIRNPPLTVWLVIGTNCVIFFFEVLLSDANLQAAFQHLGVVPAYFLCPDWAARTGNPASGGSKEAETGAMIQSRSEFER